MNKPLWTPIMTDESLIYKTHYESFNEDVLILSHKKPIIVDLWAEWCSPCIVIAPILEKVIKDYAGRIALAKLEVDEGENMKIAGQYHVRGFPTILLIQNGKETDRFSGAKPAHFIEKFIDSHINV